MRNVLFSILERILGAVVLAGVVNVVTSGIDLPLPVTITIGLVALLGLMAVAFLRRTPAPVSMPPPLRPVTTAHLLASLGQGGHVAWVDRQATSVDQLHPPRARIVITGRPKTGKTREAIQLICRAVAHDRIPPDRVFEPTPTLRLLPIDLLRSRLQSYLDTLLPALLFVDDLPYHFQRDGLTRLAEALAILDGCKSSYVVATARSDQLSPEHRDWLDQNGFCTVELTDLLAPQAAALIDNAAGTFGLALEPAARLAIVNHRDGTAGQIVAALRFLRAEGIHWVTEHAAQLVAFKTVRELWTEVRAYMRESIPGTPPLLDALATFHSAYVTPSAPLVLAYAATLWPQTSPWRRPWRVRPRLRLALERLGSLGINLNSGQIDAPDIAIEGDVAPEDARKRLSPFLLGHRRLLRNRWLRRFHAYALQQSEALQALAWENLGNGETHHALVHLASAASLAPRDYGLIGLRLVCLASLHESACSLDELRRALRTMPLLIRVVYPLLFLLGPLPEEDTPKRTAEVIALSPWYIRPIVRSAASLPPEEHRMRPGSHTGKAETTVGLLEAGVIWLSKRSPALAYPVFSMAARAKEARADIPGAIEAYTLAIAVQPELVDSWLGRAAAHHKAGHYEDAIRDYDQVIALAPQMVGAYYNRGLAHADLEQHHAAIEDLDRAAARRPDDAKIYFQRGTAKSNLGHYDAAIRDFDAAISLGPASPLPYLGRAFAHAGRKDYPQAITDYTASIRLYSDDPDRARAYQGRGLSYHEQGDKKQAVADWSEAIRLLPNGQRRAETYLMRAVAQAELGLAEAALDDCSQAFAVAPASAFLYHGKAYVQSLLGRSEEACASLAEAIALDPAYRVNLRTDSDFDSIRTEPCFHALIGDSFLSTRDT